jgi:hypothetical protein
MDGNGVPETKVRNKAIDAFDKRKAALELRRIGMAFEDIAKAVGYASRGAAHVAYRQAMKESLRESGSEEQRQIEVERLDRLQQELWPLAMHRTVTKRDKAGRFESVEVPPNVKAVGHILHIIRTRAELLGLFAPVKHQVISPLVDRQQQQQMIMTEKGYDLLCQLEGEILRLPKPVSVQEDDGGDVREDGE